MSKVVVYAAGGAAINVTKTLYQPQADALKDDGIALVQVVFLDTSRSTLS